MHRMLPHHHHLNNGMFRTYLMEIYGHFERVMIGVGYTSL
jgi:hypothetical protein